MLTEPDILQALMRWRTRVSAAAWVVVRDAHAAEDIFQNVALKAMTREVSFENESALMSWAFITAQPAPTNSWACDLGRVPEVILGRWLPPTARERARLGAEPLLWPISERDSLMLYAAALAAWKSSEHPVVLHADSKLRFRGRTEQAQMVRFGFSAQVIRGVFAGKFEVDVPPASLGPTGETWEVELPLANFRALHPHLAVSPEGLELTDVYALTVKDDAGLEINHIELVSQK